MATDQDAVTGSSGDLLCDECQAADAVLAAHYPGIRARPPRWCDRCAGPLLAGLVARGQVVTVTGLPAGLLAVQDSAIELDGETGIADLPWTVELAIEILRFVKPPGLAFARALVDEGGAATADRLREILGVPQLNHATSTLNAAVRTVTGRRRLRYSDRHLAKPLPPPDDPRRKVVHSYELPLHLVPILDKALISIGRPPGATQVGLDGTSAAAGSS